MRLGIGHTGNAPHIGLWCCLAAIGVTSLGVADEPATATLTAEDVLARMARVYAECRTYRDTGLVSTLFIDPKKPWTDERPFTTAFVRPDAFRYEFLWGKPGRPQRYIVWRRGDDVRSWWDLKPGIERQESLSLGLAGATGVSGGSAHTIPALLLPDEVGGRLITEIVDAERIEDETIGEAACIRIRGRFGDSPTTLWIDSETFLLRKILEVTIFDTFGTETTTTYTPVIDDEIPDGHLAFGIPNG